VIQVMVKMLSNIDNRNNTRLLAFLRH